MSVKRITKLFHLGLRFPIAVLILALVLLVFSVTASRHLHIQNDLISLLPRGLESVRAVDRLREHFGGLGYLFVVIESPQTEKAEDFASRFSEAMGHLPSVLYVDYKKPVDFFLERKWFYLEPDDLREVRHRIERAEELRLKGASPVFSFLMDFADQEDRPDLTFQDIFEKYEKKFSSFLQDSEADASSHMITFRVKLRENPQNFEATQNFMGEIRRLEQKVRSANAFQAVSVGYTGSYQKMLEQTQLTRREMMFVSAVVGAALFIILVLYFGRVSSALLVSIPVATGVIWTGGVVAVTLGHLNVITSFAAAILGGLGSDYGVYLLSRFHEERSMGMDFLGACERAFAKTGKATYLSMMTTVAAFVALLLSHFRLFIEFGIVGTIGLVLNYMTMMLLIPAWLALEHRMGWRINFDKPRWRVGLEKNLQRKVGRIYGFLATRKSGALAWGIGGLCVIAALTIPGESVIHFNDGQVESRKLPSYALADRISARSPVSLNPTALIFSDPEDEAKVVGWLQSLLDQKREDLIYNQVLGLSSFIPSQPEAKRALLGEILEKARASKALVPSQKDELVRSLRESLELGPATRSGLPLEVKRLFSNVNNGPESVAYLYPNFGRNDKSSMEKFSKGIEALRRDTGVRFEIADGTMVNLDVVRMIDREAPKGLVFVLGFLAAISLFSLRPIQRGLFIILSLLAGLFLISGVLRCLGIELNIINIAVIPVVLGTGIDCFVHMSERFSEVGKVRPVLESKVPPILISNLTTLVGFGGLLLTSSAGIRSAGWVSMTGIAIMTLLCVLVFPKWLAWEKKLRI